MTLLSVFIPAGQRPGPATLLAASVVIAATLAGCSSGSTDGQVGGNPEVYDRIEATTSCPELQAEFDIAMDNVDAREPGDPVRQVSLGYAEAAETRMRELAC